ncbi:MAG: CRISPR-associated endonuclease Cas1 [Bryobacterales bacterium]|nr:CRISPR-associated endonuclease Cas1 [Bryobacterales bacterium]
MATLPIAPQPASRELPDYLPARMVNEFVYCPRLFFYEFVEDLFRPSVDTEEGKVLHKRVDREGGRLPPPEEIGEERIHSRSITLSSDRYRLIAGMDLLEVEDGAVTPVDYKHGRPRETSAGLELWPTDRIQLAVQGLVLRENGYRCEEGLVFYAKTRQRVRVVFDGPLMEETLQVVAEAWRTAASGVLPPPLSDSPKCTGCSLAPICLPDETNALRAAPRQPDETGQLSLFDTGPPRKPVAAEVRRLVTPRDDLRPVYLDTQGLRVGKSGEVLQVREKDTLRQEIRIGETCQVNLMGNIQISTQAVQTLCSAEVPICYFSQGGWFYGITTGLSTRNVFLRRSQFRLAESEAFCLHLARKLVAGKIRNQRTMLLRNHIEPPGPALRAMKDLAARAERGSSLDELLGIEGAAGRFYFGEFAGMLKSPDTENAAAPFSFDFAKRNRRPPRDPVNALLSLGYSLLAKDLTLACYAVGFDPMMGFYHQLRFGRPALALDLMEPFRPLIVDSAVLNAINTRMLAPRDFVRAGGAVVLSPEGRKAFYRAYELRMDSLVTHPLFDYRVSYRRLLEIQARLLARVLEGEIGEYPVFVTR